MACLAASRLVAGDVGNDEILPDGEANFAVAVAVGNLGKSEHLCHGQAAHGDGDADVVQARLRLRVNADVAGAVDGVARLAGIERGRE